MKSPDPHLSRRQTIAVFYDLVFWFGYKKWSRV
jgi:hypothetical protein